MHDKLRAMLGLNDTKTRTLLRLMTWERIAREQICALATCGHQSIKLSSVNGIVGGLRRKLAVHGVAIAGINRFGSSFPEKPAEGVQAAGQVRRQWKHRDAPAEARR